ncbi:hypothetical protein J0J24_24670, partial [Vibrio vulnificus]
GQSLAISADSDVQALGAVEQNDTFQLLLELTIAPQALAGEQRSDSRCFLATALFAEQPQTLDYYRHFRDDVLLKLPGGE